MNYPQEVNQKKYMRKSSPMKTRSTRQSFEGLSNEFSLQSQSLFNVSVSRLQDICADKDLISALNNVALRFISSKQPVGRQQIEADVSKRAYELRAGKASGPIQIEPSHILLDIVVSVQAVKNKSAATSSNEPPPKKSKTVSKTASKAVSIVPTQLSVNVGHCVFATSTGSSALNIEKVVH